jgi:putative aminopeptidase FrvX
VFSEGFYLENGMPAETREMLTRRYEETMKAAGRPLAPREGPMSVEELRQVAQQDGMATNTMAMLKGTGPHKDEVIVVMAHLDHVGVGRNGAVNNGADDNASGSSVLMASIPELVEAQKRGELDRTVVFLWTGAEEKGLVGSRAMTKAIPEEQLPEYCAMINIDSLGLGPPQVADNMSSKPLATFTGELAKQMEIPFAHASIGSANSDSSSFVARKIPAVTIHGLNKHWHRVLHSGNDQPAKVNAASVYLGYRLALGMIVRLDEAACTAYR